MGFDLLGEGDGAPLDWDRDGDSDEFDLLITHHAYELERSASRGAAGCCALPLISGGLLLAAMLVAARVALRLPPAPIPR